MREFDVYLIFLSFRSIPRIQIARIHFAGGSRGAPGKTDARDLYSGKVLKFYYILGTLHAFHFLRGTEAKPLVVVVAIYVCIAVICSSTATALKCLARLRKFAPLRRTSRMGHN